MLLAPAVSLLLAAAAAQDDPPAQPAPAAPVSGEVRLLGDELDGLDVRVDLDRGLLRFVGGSGSAAVEVPVGAVVRPSRPARRFAFAADRVETLAGEEGDDGIVAALFRLPRAGDPDDAGASSDAGAVVTVGVRGGPFGPVVTYSLPRRAFRGLQHRTTFEGAGAPPTVGRGPDGRPLRVASAPATDGVAVEAPGRLRLLVGEGFAAHPLGTLRLRGALGVDDASDDGAAASLVVRVDGADVGGATARRGEPARPFDVPLRDGRELSLAVDPAGDAIGAAVAVLAGARLEGPAGFALRLSDVLRADRAGVELLAGVGGGFAGGGSLVPRAPEPDPAREGVAWIDATRAAGTGAAPGPLLLPFDAPDGLTVGVGLVHLPDATRFGCDADGGGGVVVGIPTPLLASEPAERAEEEDEELVRVTAALVAGRSPQELYERYRSTLIATGGSATRRAAGSLTVPDWWRHPLVFCEPPPGRGRFGRFDVHEIEKRVADVERRLGLARFSVVVDGDWTSRAGDPRPSEEFERLRVLTAAQHVKGRHVLLRWPLFAAAPGSLADVIGAQADGRLVAGRPKKVAAFLHEVVRACLGDGLHSLGADGFVLTGTADLIDPTRAAAAVDLEAGVGWRELKSVLRVLRREIDRRGLDESLLAAPCAVPQLVTEQDAIVFDPGTADRVTREARLERLVAVLPDLPVLMRPLDAATEEVLDWAARAVAIGVPSVGSRTLARLDDGEARALGAILSLAAARPLGLPRRAGDGWRMEFEDRVLARTLPDRAGVAVFPARSVALVALTRDGDASLPFEPVSVEAGDGATIEFSDGGVSLVGGRAGTVYRLRTE